MDWNDERVDRFAGRTLDIIGCLATLIMLALAVAEWVLKFIL